MGRTSIQYVLDAKSEHDQGARSSLAALRRRVLTEIMDDRVEVFPIGLVPRVRVKLTTLGRATAHAGLSRRHAAWRPNHALRQARRPLRGAWAGRHRRARYRFRRTTNGWRSRHAERQAASALSRLGSSRR